MGVGSAPVDDNGKPVLVLWNDATGQPIPVHVGATVTGADGKTYALLDVNATVSPAANQRVNTHAGDIAAGSAVAGAFVDGADTTQGLTTDAAATTDTGTFTLMALVKRLLAKFPTIGPQAKSASVSVTFATDNPKAGVTAASGDFADGAIATIGTEADAAWSSGSGTVISLLKAIFSKILFVSRSAVAVYSLASTATTSSSNSGDLAVGPYTEISIDINTTAKTGTTPTIQFTYSRKGADGIYYPLWQSAVITNVAANTISTSIGAGMAYNQSLGSTGQLSWVIGGSATPGYTFSANITGK